MEEEINHSPHVPAASSCSSFVTAIPTNDPSSSSSPSTSLFQAEEANLQHVNENNQHNYQHQQQLPSISYLVNSSMGNPPLTQMKDDAWSCLIMLVTLWFFASMTLIFGFYGSENLHLGPNCSRLREINPMLVQSVKVTQIDEPKPGLMLYGFNGPPSLDVKINWTETYNAFITANFYKQWIFYLNKESHLDIYYTVKSPRSSPLSLVISKGREDPFEWIEDPSLPKTTLYWNIIYGSGKIEQKMSQSFTYYVQVANMNAEDVEVELKFTVNAFIYNTTNACYRCSLDNGLCKPNLSLSRSNYAVLTTPGPRQGTSDDEYWFHVKLSYGPRWITYIIASGMMTVVILFALRFCNMFQNNDEEMIGSQQLHVASERSPLLPNKDNDLLSRSSSYESFSHEEEDLREWIAVNSVEGKQIKEGERNNNLCRLCVICFDAPRDCFFLPCGHSAACFACGTRIAAEACTCPICRRNIKKVRKIFAV